MHNPIRSRDGPRKPKPDAEKRGRTAARRESDRPASVVSASVGSASVGFAWVRPVVIAAVVLLVIQWGDRQARQHEFQSLLNRAAQAQTTADDAARRVLSTRAYTMPLLVTSSSATVRAGLEQLVEQSAAEAAADVREARANVAKADVVPWHLSARSANRAELAYLDQRIADFNQVANGADLSLLYSPKARAAAGVAIAAMQRTAPNDLDAHEVQVVLPLPQ